MYRARFDERRHATEAVDSLYVQTADGCDIETRAWLIAVAHPRVPDLVRRPTREDARRVFHDARRTTLTYSRNVGGHPLENVDHLNPRPGLRRWTAASTAGDGAAWSEAWAGTHHDGSVTMAAVVGGQHKTAFDNYDLHEVEGRSIECAIADFVALVHATAVGSHRDEYDVRVGIEWSGELPIQLLENDAQGNTYHGSVAPLRRFSPVVTTLNAAGSAESLHLQVRQLAEDCVNQGGITDLHVIHQAQEADDR